MTREMILVLDWSRKPSKVEGNALLDNDGTDTAQRSEAGQR